MGNCGLHFPLNDRTHRGWLINEVQEKVMRRADGAEELNRRDAENAEGTKDTKELSDHAYQSWSAPQPLSIGSIIRWYFQTT